MSEREESKAIDGKPFLPVPGVAEALGVSQAYLVSMDRDQAAAVVLLIRGVLEAPQER